MMSLNVGCGGDRWGKVRLDIARNVRPTIIADIQHLPFVDNSFDVAKASHVLEHVNNPYEALDEIV